MWFVVGKFVCWHQDNTQLIGNQNKMYLCRLSSQITVCLMWLNKVQLPLSLTLEERRGEERRGEERTGEDRRGEERRGQERRGEERRGEERRGEERRGEEVQFAFIFPVELPKWTCCPQVQSLMERLVVFLLSQVVERSSQEGALFSLHPCTESCKLLWTDSQAVGFYSVKHKGAMDKFHLNGFVGVNLE